MRPIREPRHDGTYTHPNGDPNASLPFLRRDGKVLSTWTFDCEDERALLASGGVPWLLLYGLYMRLMSIHPGAVLDEEERLLVRAGITHDGATKFRFHDFTTGDRERLLDTGRIDILIPIEPIPPMLVLIDRQ